jgi:hypothetical protein
MAQVKPPSGSKSFRLHRFNETKYKRDDRSVTKQVPGPPLTGDADPTTGKVANEWATTSWNLLAVRERFGAGRYRVVWLGADGKKMGGDTFELTKPEPQPAIVAPATAEREAGDVESLRGQISGLDLFMLLQKERDRADARAGERAERDAERDRERMRDERERDRQFFTLMLGQVEKATKPTAGAGADFDLLRRELALSTREELAHMRAEVSATLGRIDTGDDYKPPKNVTEAASRVGIALIEELEEEAPELVKDAIPAVVRWLRSKGRKPSAKVQRQIDELARTQRATQRTSDREAARIARGLQESANGATDDDDDDEGEDEQAGADA